MSKRIQPFEKELIIDFLCEDNIVGTAVVATVGSLKAGVSIKSISETNKNRKKSLDIARGRVLKSSNNYHYQNFDIGMPRLFYPYTMEIEQLIIIDKLEKLLEDYNKIKDNKYIKVDITDEIKIEVFKSNSPLPFLSMPKISKE